MKKLVMIALSLANSVSFATVSQHVSRTAGGHPSKLAIKADFEQDWQRYPSPDAVIQELSTQFPLAKTAEMNASCTSLTDENRSLLGDNNPTTGFTSIAQPNSSFISWYSGCLTSYLTADFKARFVSAVTDSKSGIQTPKTLPQAKETAVSYFGQEYSKECAAVNPYGAHLVANPFENYFTDYSNCAWSKLPTATRLAIINFNLQLHIGPDAVLNDLGLQQQNGELAQKVLSFIDAASANQNFARDGFSDLGRISLSTSQETNSLTILSATEVMKYLILQTAYLKY